MRPIHVLVTTLLGITSLSCTQEISHPNPLQIVETGPHQWAVSGFGTTWGLEGVPPRIQTIERAGRQLLDCTDCGKEIVVSGVRVDELTHALTVDLDENSIDSLVEVSGVGTIHTTHSFGSYGSSLTGSIVTTHDITLEVYAQVVRAPTDKWDFIEISASGMTMLLEPIDGIATERALIRDNLRGGTVCLLSVGVSDTALIMHGSDPATDWEIVQTGGYISVRRKIVRGEIPAGTTIEWDHLVEISTRCP